MKDIDWSKQHCGVHQAHIEDLCYLMPDLVPLLETFPDNAFDFTWDVKVHMLMPRQYPCIPNWHVDNVPRSKDGRQEFDKVQLDKPMYLWISNGPLTEFENGYIRPKTWVKFNQADSHRGTAAQEFCWRGFIRATHKDILPYDGSRTLQQIQRRHCQVYVPEDYKW